MAAIREGVKEGFEGSSMVPIGGFAKHKQQNTGMFRSLAIQDWGANIVSQSLEQLVEHMHHKVSKCLRCCVDRLFVEGCEFIYFYQHRLVFEISSAKLAMWKQISDASDVWQS